MDKSDQETRQAIIAEIESAFADVKRGNGITLHQARVLDDYGDEAQQAEARKKDRDFCWQEIPDALVEELPDTLPFLDPEGFRYYVPVYMIWALKHYRDSDCWAGDAIIYAFESYEPDNDLHAHQMDKFKLFSPAQRKAIALFLRYFAEFADKGCADTDVAKSALDQYWNQFL